MGEVWQRGFSETRVEDRQSFLRHREYIAANPVKSGLVNAPEENPLFRLPGKEEGSGAETQKG
jgi:hypothetical protein